MQMIAAKLINVQGSTTILLVNYIKDNNKRSNKRFHLGGPLSFPFTRRRDVGISTIQLVEGRPPPPTPFAIPTSRIIIAYNGKTFTTI
jgi:hypothetical protein